MFLQVTSLPRLSSSSETETKKCVWTWITPRLSRGELCDGSPRLGRCLRGRTRARALGALPELCLQPVLRAPQVSVPPGALDCWVFLSCLEVLQRIEGCCDRAQIDSNIAHTVGLWSYATEKVRSAGVGVVLGCASGAGGWTEEAVWGSVVHLVITPTVLGTSGCVW